MVMMEWNNALRVGHSVIDRDHQRLVGLINKLGGAMSAGHGRDFCERMLDELISYTQTHFATEEKLMSLHDYMDESRHRAEHARLVQDVLDFKDKCEAGSATLSVALLHFLMEWLTHHILESDKALVQGIPPG
jgi:hemerythrin-like metal-binding protein